MRRPRDVRLLLIQPGSTVLCRRDKNETATDSTHRVQTPAIFATPALNSYTIRKIIMSAVGLRINAQGNNLHRLDVSGSAAHCDAPACRQLGSCSGATHIKRVGEVSSHKECKVRITLWLSEMVAMKLIAGIMRTRQNNALRDLHLRLGAERVRYVQ